MKFKALLAGLVCLLMISCDDGDPILPAEGVITVLDQKEFSTTPEYISMHSVYRTSGTEWLMVFNYTQVENGTPNSLRPGMHVAYYAYYSAWIQDNMGFQHFCYFADKIVVLE